MTSRVSELRRILAFIELFTVGAAAVAAAALRGYVVDAHGQRVDGARVQAWHIVATDQRPPQRPTLLAQTTTDAHGNFSLSVGAYKVNMIIASFGNQSGAAPPSFNGPVRVKLRHNRPRLVGSGPKDQ
jgi:hypothetical protein